MKEMKITTEVGNTENEQTIINETKSKSFEMIAKMDEPLARLTKKEEMETTNTENDTGDLQPQKHNHVINHMVLNLAAYMKWVNSLKNTKFQ